MLVLRNALSIRTDGEAANFIEVLGTGGEICEVESANGNSLLELNQTFDTAANILPAPPAGYRWMLVTARQGNVVISSRYELHKIPDSQITQVPSLPGSSSEKDRMSDATCRTECYKDMQFGGCQPEGAALKDLWEATDKPKLKTLLGTPSGRVKAMRGLLLKLLQGGLGDRCSEGAGSHMMKIYTKDADYAPCFAEFVNSPQISRQALSKILQELDASYEQASAEFKVSQNDHLWQRNRVEQGDLQALAAVQSLSSDERSDIQEYVLHYYGECATVSNAGDRRFSVTHRLTTVWMDMDMRLIWQDESRSKC